MTNQKTNTNDQAASVLLKTILTQWRLLGGGAVIVGLVIDAQGNWGIYESRRLNAGETDQFLLASIKGADQNINQKGGGDYFG